MTTEIKVWQVNDGQLMAIEKTLPEAGRKETKDLGKWIKSDPSILGDDIVIIGEQVQTKSGPLDFLGIDATGSTVIIELKRDRLPREVLAQAIDYVSDVASWETEKLSAVCEKYNDQPLDAFMTENLEVDIEDISINQSQRILLVGTVVEESLQRMIEWLANNYGVSVNALLFKYIHTKGGEEFLAKTTIIPEDVEKERSQKQQRKMQLSDDPGSYEDNELRKLLSQYLSQNHHVPRRIREIVLPLCLDHEPIKREEIKKELLRKNEAKDEGQAGRMLTTISGALGAMRRDYLRQVIRYDKTLHEKENYRIEERYRSMIKSLLDEFQAKKRH